MPFEIVRNDIINMRVVAIVNTANPRPVVGYGVDAGIHRAAGPKLLEARQKIGNIWVGDAAITPVWLDGSHNAEKLLRACDQQSLNLLRRAAFVDACVFSPPVIC